MPPTPFNRKIAVMIRQLCYSVPQTVTFISLPIVFMLQKIF